MRIPTLLIILLLGFVRVSAQEAEPKDDTSTVQLYYPSWRIGFSPSALINVFGGLQFSLDKGFPYQGINLSLEAGYLFAQNVDFGVSNGIRGYRVKSGIEYLLSNTEHLGLSFGGFALYRSLGIKKTQLLMYPGYTKYVDYIQHKRLLGFMGQLTLSAITDLSIMFDWGIGFGVGTLIVENDTLFPPGTLDDFLSPLLPFNTPGTYLIPIGSFNFNISYSF